MRIKIIGENNCARATRHLLRLAGFAVTDFLPAEALTQGPSSGYAITIDLSPAHTPNSCLEPEPATHESKSSSSEEAERMHRDASSPSFAKTASAGEPSFVEGSTGEPGPANTGSSYGHLGLIHFDSVDSALESAVLRHVSQLAAGAVIVDRPGGVVRSERELRIVAPNTGDARADEAAAVAIEFGVLRGLLDLVAPDARGSLRWNGAGKALLRGDAGGSGAEAIQGVGFKKKWWPFAVVLMVGALGVWRGSGAASIRGIGRLAAAPVDRVMESHRLALLLNRFRLRVDCLGLGWLMC